MTCRQADILIRQVPSLPELKVNAWTSALAWRGLTLEPVSFKVTAQPAEAEIWWRRYGVGFSASEGKFSGTHVFNIFPGELFLRIDLLTTAHGVTAVAEQLQR
jgi:hypothetical protein